MKRRPKQRRQWSRAELYQECRAAPVVWGAIEDMAIERGSPVITPTRKQLAPATGIKTLWMISTSLTALHEAGWVIRTLVPVFEGRQQVRRLIRLVLTRKEFTALFRKCRKSTVTAQKKQSAKRVSRKCRKSTVTESATEVSKIDTRLSYGKGVATTPPPLPAARGVETGHPPDGTHNTPPYEWQPGDPDWVRRPSSDTEVIKHGK